MMDDLKAGQPWAIEGMERLGVREVGSFEALMATPLVGPLNALVWRRKLKGDFAAVLAALPIGEGITTLEEEALLALPLSEAGRVAREVMLEDVRRLREQGLEPVLDCVHGYLRDADLGMVPTDVFSFHVDSATAEADTFLCTYHGLSSEGLANADAVRKVDVPEIRAALLEAFGGGDDAAFAEYLSDQCFDLHYQPLPGARTYSFGVGNLWRIAVQHPGSKALPCIHRAPETPPGSEPRLLLIS
jgi:hypothetical protein